MIIIGGGELTKKIETSNQNLDLFKIRGTKTNNEIYAGKNLNNIQNVEIPKGNNLCIINWSHQFIKNFEHLKYAIEGVENISKFMLKNPKLNYIYISSTSANLSFNYKSLYGLYKFLSENILKDVSKNKKINLNIIRLGLMYGTKNCPIKKIYKYRKYGIKIIVGNPEAKFSVTSADEVAKKILEPESEIWHFRENESYFIDSKNVSINYIHQIFNKKGNINDLLTLKIKNNDLIHKLSNLFGKKIDLSLAEQDRYPSLFDNINFSGSCLENYILGI